MIKKLNFHELRFFIHVNEIHERVSYLSRKKLAHSLLAQKMNAYTNRDAFSFAIIPTAIILPDASHVQPSSWYPFEQQVAESGHGDNVGDAGIGKEEEVWNSVRDEQRINQHANHAHPIHNRPHLLIYDDEHGYDASVGPHMIRRWHKEHKARTRLVTDDQLSHRVQNFLRPKPTKSYSAPKKLIFYR